MTTSGTPKTKEKLTNYQEFINVSNILEKIFLITLIATAILFWVWSRDGIGVGGKSIAIIFTITLILFFLNRKGYPRTAGNILFIATSVVLTYLATHEDGIYNVPFIFFPILLIFSSIIFGRQMVIAYTGTIIGLTTLLFVLDRVGIIVPFDGTVTWAPDYFVIAIVIIFATGAILHLAMGKIEHNLVQIVQAEKSIKDTYQLTLESWAKALELGGRETPGHSQRVITLVKGFANYLQLDQAFCEEIIKGALLHDIGKMGIPDSILLKPGNLTDEEYKYCQRHVRYSGQILQDVSDFEVAMDIPVYHHEQWDGNGYPKNLAGENIPFAARLFAVIDNWDSLTNQQVYRKAWSKDETISYLKQQAGKKFDEKIINKFLVFIGQNHGTDTQH